MPTRYPSRPTPTHFTQKKYLRSNELDYDRCCLQLFYIFEGNFINYRTFRGSHILELLHLGHLKTCSRGQDRFSSNGNGFFDKSPHISYFYSSIYIVSFNQTCLNILPETWNVTIIFPSFLVGSNGTDVPLILLLYPGLNKTMSSE